MFRGVDDSVFVDHLIMLLCYNSQRITAYSEATNTDYFYCVALVADRLVFSFLCRIIIIVIKALVKALRRGEAVI